MDLNGSTSRQAAEREGPGKAPARTAAQMDILVPSFRDPRILDTIAGCQRADTRGITRMVIMDGGSAPDLVEAMGALLRPWDLLVSERDKGVFDALNKALDASAAPYVGWLGSDDLFHPDFRFEDALEAFGEGGVDGVVFGTLFTRGGRVVRAMRPRAMNAMRYRLGLHVPHFSSFWARDFIGTTRFPMGLAADIEFFYDLVVTRRAQVRCLSKVSTLMADGGESNAGLARILKTNRLALGYYRRHQGALLSLLAVALKLASKELSVVRYKLLNAFGSGRKAP
jgi:glycosyltransferase